MPTQNAEASLAALSEASGLPLDQMRGLPARPRRRLRPSRRHAGLRAPGGRHRQGVSRRAGEADLEPRGRPGARLLPADLAMQARRPASTPKAISSGLHMRVSGQSINAYLEPGRHQRRQGHAPAPGLLEAARRRAARLHRAEPSDRVRDAQHPRAGRPVARRQHQPERRLHGVLHRRGGARRPARIRSSFAARS